MLSLQQYSKEELKEMSFLELAHWILAEKREPMFFKDLLAEIKGHLEISDAEVKKRMLQFYTDLNIDGSFLPLGENKWGLRAWYPVEKLEEETTNAPVKTRKKKAKKVVEEIFEEEVLEEEEDLDEFDEDSFDDLADVLDDDDDDEADDVEDDADDIDEDLDEDLDLDIVDEDADDDFEEEEGAEDEYNLEDK